MLCRVSHAFFDDLGIPVFIFCTLSTPLSYLFRKLFKFSIFSSLISIDLFPWSWPLPIIETSWQSLSSLKHLPASAQEQQSHMWHKHGKQINIRNSTLETGGALKSCMYTEIYYLWNSHTIQSSGFQNLPNFAGNLYPFSNSNSSW